MLGTSDDFLVEEVPMPEPAIAAEIKLAGTEAADGHANFLEAGTAIGGAFAAGGEGGDPFGRQLLVGGNEVIEIRAGERAGHGVFPGMKGQRRQAASPQSPQKIAARNLIRRNGRGSGLGWLHWIFRVRSE